jgi:Xaa-Pro dipeptidase
LNGSEGVNVNDEDTEYVDFYQNGHFMYLFGLEERNCYGVIEIDTGKQVVFIPRLSEDYKMWMIVRTK